MTLLFAMNADRARVTKHALARCSMLSYHLTRQILLRTSDAESDGENENVLKSEATAVVGIAYVLRPLPRVIYRIPWSRSFWYEKAT
jgi:hypothetical protein